MGVMVFSQPLKFYISSIVLNYVYTYTAYRNNYTASPFNQNTI